MSERRHHTKLKREELALLRRYDLDELAFKTGVSKTTLWNALHGRELRQKTREKITAWTAKEKARDLKALKGSHLDVWRSRVFASNPAFFASSGVITSRNRTHRPSRLLHTSR